MPFQKFYGRQLNTNCSRPVWKKISQPLQIRSRHSSWNVVQGLFLRPRQQRVIGTKCRVDHQKAKLTSVIAVSAMQAITSCYFLLSNNSKQRCSDHSCRVLLWHGMGRRPLVPVQVAVSLPACLADHPTLSLSSPIKKKPHLFLHKLRLETWPSTDMHCLIRIWLKMNQHLIKMISMWAVQSILYMMTP